MARFKIEQLIALQNNKTPSSLSFPLSELEGEWELVLSTVPHGIFRSSPFFLAIQEAYKIGGQADKAELFFKLHELQTCSWGASKVRIYCAYYTLYTVHSGPRGLSFFSSFFLSFFLFSFFFFPF